MEPVNRLPRPEDPAALERLAEAQQLLCARAVSEEDCQHAVELLLELARPLEEGGFGYSPALLTLASLYETGYEPAIQQDAGQAARHYMSLLEAQVPSHSLSNDLLEEAATNLCSLVKDKECHLQEAEVKRLEVLARQCEDWPLRSAAGWVSFTASEAQRRWNEANEDPEVRQRRKERDAQKAEQRQRILAEQQRRAQEALAQAEELRLQGNDMCRQGQLPGNAAAQQHLLQAVALYAQAVDVLSRCLDQQMPLEEAQALRRQRALLRSNSAQVELSNQRWREAATLAEQSLEDDPASVKTRYRLAKAHMGRSDWETAAKTVDEALRDAVKGPSGERETFTLEFWKLAEEISQELPEWRWSASKPEQRKVAQDDYEKRIVGWWEYPGSKFEIRLEPWGALIFQEDTVKVDLMKKGKLRWRGEIELISGMILNLSFEPGSDVLVLEFIPPPDMPEQDQWSGPRRFTANRAKTAEVEKVAEVVGEVKEVVVEEPLRPTSEPEPAPEPGPTEDCAEEESLANVLEEAPKEVFLSGYPTVAGRYLLQPELKNGRPVYRGARSERSNEQFLWFRGGNWGVTESLNTSALAAPFTVRCADGRALHPLQLRRRAKWYARSGRNQEDPAPELIVTAARTPEEVVKSESDKTLPSWVASASVDVEDQELRVQVLFQGGLSVSLQQLDMSASESILHLALEHHSQSLELPLPVTLTSEQSEKLKAKWSEKTQTLKVRVSLH